MKTAKAKAVSKAREAVSLGRPMLQKNDGDSTLLMPKCIIPKGWKTRNAHLKNCLGIEVNSLGATAIEKYLYTVFQRSQISVRRQTQKRGLRVLFAQHWVWHFHLILMPRGAQNSLLQRPNEASCWLHYHLPSTFLTTADPGLGSSGCLSEDIRAVPTAWRGRALRSKHFRDHSDFFFGYYRYNVGCLPHLKINRTGDNWFEQKGDITLKTEYHQKPTSTSHYQLMSFQPSCISPDLQPQTFGQNKGPRNQSPNSCRQLKARFQLKISSIWLVTFPTQIVAQTGNKTNEDIGTFSTVKASVGPFLSCCSKASLQYFQI